MQPGISFRSSQTVIPFFHHTWWLIKYMQVGTSKRITESHHARTNLRVRDNADDGAIFLHLGEIFLYFLFAVLGRPFLGVFGEGLLLGRVPERDEKTK